MTATATDERLTDRPHLILGAIDDYAFHEVEPFIVSLRQAGFRGHVCVFAGPRISRSCRRRLERLGVEVIRVTGVFPFVADPHPRNVKKLPAPIHICNYRYYLYYDYLLKRGSEFRNVLLTDVRDVVFQRDPFDFPIEDCVHVVMENPDIPIGKCPWTGQWVIAAYGEEMARRLENEPMSCSGTTVGPVGAMKEYLRSMLREISAMNSADAYLDQAAHNVLLHRGALQRVKRLHNFEGPILTVGSEPRYQLNADKMLVNRDGSVIAVVHQYDRHEELVRMFEAKVRPSPLRRFAAATAQRLRRRMRRWRRQLGGGRDSAAAL